MFFTISLGADVCDFLFAFVGDKALGFDIET